MNNHANSYDLLKTANANFNHGFKIGVEAGKALNRHAFMDGMVWGLVFSAAVSVLTVIVLL